MTKNVITYICISILFVTMSCKDDFTGENNQSNKIVVDGYIEAGNYAKIILTSPLPLNALIDSSSYLDVVITRAKVSISDGETTEILTLTRNENAFPQHYYVTRTMKGKAGKTYWLEVIYQNDTIRSKTTIPNEISIDSIWTITDPKDTLKSNIWITFCDNGNEKNFYRAFSKIQGKQQEYVPTYLSAFNDEFINGKCSDVPIYKGVENFFDKDKEDSYSKGDTVFIKASTIDETSYKFWKNYEKEVFNSGNPFSGHGSNLTSNIVGGIGIWCGYNSNYYRVIVK